MKPLHAPEGARAVVHALCRGNGSDRADRCLQQLELFAGWLAGPGIERGLLGPREAERIWPRHVVNCALLAPLPPESGSTCDLGSGAGLPGLVLAVLRPDLSVTLLEPLQRRSDFLQEVVDELSLANATVVRARAEDYAQTGPRHDLVVARAVAPLSRLLGWAMPLLRPGGELLALKGANATDELAQAGPELARWDVVDAGVCTLTEGGNVAHAVRVVRPRPRARAGSRRRTDD